MIENLLNIDFPMYSMYVYSIFPMYRNKIKNKVANKKINLLHVADNV